MPDELEKKEDTEEVKTDVSDKEPSEEALRKEIMEEVYAEEGIEDKPVEKIEEQEPEEKIEKKTESEKETKESVKDEIKADDPLAGINQTLQNIDGRLKQSESRLGSLINQIHNAGKEAEKKGAEAPTKEQIAESAKTEEAWDELKEDFPEWATAIEGKLKASSAKIADELPKIQKELKADIESFKDTLSFEFEKKIVSSHHPGWEKTVQTPDYINWLNAQPDDIRQKHFSDKSEDAIDLLNRFTKKDNGTGKETTGKTAEEIAASRQDRLKKSTALKTTHKEKPVKSESDMTVTELRKKMAQQVWNE